MSLGGALRGCLYNRQSPLSVTVRALYAWVDCIVPHVRWDREASGEDGSAASHMTNPFDSLLNNYFLGNYIKKAASDVSSRERAELWVYRDIIV